VAPQILILTRPLVTWHLQGPARNFGAWRKSGRVSGRSKETSEWRLKGDQLDSGVIDCSGVCFVEDKHPLERAAGATVDRAD
jgi:hypothetical protein